MGAVVAGAGEGGGRYLGVGTVLHCSGTGSPYVWVGNVGYVPKHCNYPPLAEAMAEAVLQGVETYVTRLQNAVEQYISTSIIMDLCLVAEQRLGARMLKRWWVQ